MKRLFTVLSLTGLFLFLSSYKISAQVNEQDSLALVDLYISTDGPNWTNNTNWLTGSVDSWYGVTVDAGNVTKVLLNNNNLTDSVGLGPMSNLRVLYLNDNNISRLSSGLSLVQPLDSLRIDNTNISDITPLHSNNPQALYCYDTYLTFEDIEPVYMPVEHRYSPVNDVRLDIDTLYVTEGEDVNFNVWDYLVTPMGGEYNQYQWYRSPSKFGSLTQDSVLHIPAFTYESDTGTYYLEITNTLVTELTINTERVYITTAAAISNAVNEQDSLALVALYNNCNGPNWNNNSGWLVDPVSQWYGVNHIANQRIISLELAGQNLTGSIPVSINNLDMLQELYLQNNQLSDISNLSSGLSSLHYVELGENNITDFSSIANLSSLTYIGVWGNNISDISFLAGLSNLITTQLNSNNISDLSALENLPVLSEIYLDNNSVSDILPLVNNTNLGVGNAINLYYNPLSQAAQLTDIPALEARGVTVNWSVSEGGWQPPVNEQDSLALVALYNNCNGPNWNRSTNWLTGPVSTWSDIRVQNQRVTEISFEGNNLTGSLPAEFSNLDSLIFLELSGNVLTDISIISSCTKLDRLYISGLNLSNYTFFSSLINLTEISAWDIGITNLDPLAGLDKLNHLAIGQNPLSSVSGISGLTGLISLNLEYTPLTDLTPVSSLTNLNSLFLNGCSNIDDISPLSGLTQLSGLVLNDTQIEDISILSGLTNLEDLRLSHSNVSSLTPIVDNAGIGSGDRVELWELPLDQIAQQVEIPELEARGVNVDWSLSSEGWRLPVNEQDSLALVALYNQCNGDNWNDNTNWLNGNVISWYGISLNESYTKVKSIRLANNGLQGSLPADLQDLTELEDLEFDHAALSNYSSLSNIQTLRNISLVGSDLNDLGFLSALVNLQTANLHDNNISDITPLSGLTSLTHLGLADNNISDISAVTNLTSLYTLVLDNNNISDISSVSGLTSLHELLLGRNNLEDISPISGLTNLNYLTLSNNNISNISGISGLTSLSHLEISYNPISDISVIQNYIDLSSLYMIDVGCSDISAVSGLSNLFHLNISGNPVSDFSAIQNLTDLVVLEANNTGINDVDILSGLNQMSSLWLGGNTISDITPMESLNNLYDIYLSDNQITDIKALVNNSGLGEGNQVNLYNNPLSSEAINVDIPALQARGVQVEYDSGSGETWCNVQDSLALVDLYESTGGESWNNNNNWLQTAVKDWYGIGMTGERVATLSLAENNLSGSLPASLGNLTGLTRIGMNDNNITGSIPVETGNLVNLEYLNISANASLDGSIPSGIGNLTNLREVWLFNTGLSGELPSSISNLVNLTHFDVHQSNLSGEVLDLFVNLTNLERLNLGRNDFEGSVPSAIGNLTSLKYLDIWDMNLTGSLPDELGNITSLEYLDIASNQLSGELPESFSNLVNLQELWMGDNDFTGSVPASYGNLNKLTHFGIYKSSVSGEIPSSLQNMTMLKRLYLHENNLTGNIPDWLSSLDHLDLVYLQRNKLSGSIPEDITLCDSLKYLVLMDNELDGNIPADLGNLGLLKWLYLGGNNLEGSIPESFGSLDSLVVMHLRENKLTGALPSSVSGLASLNRLYLQSNMLGGLPDLTSLPLLTEHFRLQNNYFDFEDIRPNISLLADTNFLPQRPFPLNTGYIEKYETESLTLDATAMLTIQPDGTDLMYSWYRDSLALGTASTDPSYTISSLSQEDVGMYYCEITDADFPEMSLTTTSVMVDMMIMPKRMVDSLALVALYNVMGGSEWTDNSNWLSGNIDTWYGVSLTNDRVSSLSLPANKLDGVIPMDISILDKLESIDFSGNMITAPLPGEIDSLGMLTFLDLGSNPIDSDIPQWIGNINSLEYLYLDSCEITGIIPSSLGSLENIRDLDLGSNKLSGIIPDTLASNQNMQRLLLNNNQLAGAVPPQFNLLSQLKLLDIRKNDLDELPDLTATSVQSGGLKISNNRFDFEDIVPNISLINETDYRPQAQKSINVSYFSYAEGSPLELHINTVLTDSDQEASNNYTWYRNNEIYANTGSSAVLTVSQTGSDGLFHCEISNSLVPGLFITTDNFTVDEVYAPANESDSLALVQLYNSTSGQEWSRSDRWLTGILRDWYGVETYAGRVESIDLTANNLAGFIPSSLSGLDSLDYLGLSFNYSDSLGDLSGLNDSVKIDLCNNYLTYKDFYDSGLNPAVYDSLIYYPQFAMIVVRSDTTGDTITLSLDETNPDDVYSWYYNGTQMPGRVEDSLRIINRVANHGIYSCIINNSLYDQISFESEAFPLGIDLSLGVSTADHNALVALYDSTGGDNWINNRNWKSSQKVSSWYGVKISFGRVTGLNLAFNRLKGKLPGLISDLTSLENLNLYYNNLSGSIPESITGLAELRTIQFHNNDLEGVIPELIGNLDKLEVLSLYGNSLGGSFPGSIGGASSLKKILVQNNTIEGNIPEGIGALSDLEELNLSNNKLEGSVPDTIGSLGQLSLFMVSNNDLSGSLPLSLGKLSSLEYLNLSNNQLTGELSDTLSNLSLLRILDASGNRLSGSLPGFITTCPSLQSVSMQFNEFDSLPDLSLLPSSIGLNITSNKLTIQDLKDSDIDTDIQDNIRYSPQRFTDKLEIDTLGSDLSVSFIPGSGASVYNWYKDNVHITQTAKDTLFLELNESPGIFYCIAEDPGFCQLEMVSEATGYGVNTTAGVFEVDYRALVDIYNGLDGENWKNNNNWLYGRVSDWFGIRVSGGRVSGINLHGNKLNGQLPATFYDMAELKSADLSENNINGIVPAPVKEMTNLESFYLNDNDIDSIVNFSPFLDADVIRLQRNSLDFNDIRPNTGIIRSVYYAPQDSLPLTNNEITVRIGETVEVNINDYLGRDHRAEAPDYWIFKDDIYSGNNETGTIFSGKLMDSSLSGVYRFNVYDQSVPRLYLETGDLRLNILGPRVEQQDSLALVDLYNSTGGDNWIENAGWLQDPVYMWHGVVLDSGRVKMLELSNNNLTDTIPSSIGLMPGLERLLLHSNNINGLKYLGDLDFTCDIDLSLNNLKYLDFIGAGLDPGNYPGLIYSPQDDLPPPESSEDSKGEVLLTYTGYAGEDSYQWYKYGSPINGAIYDTLILKTGEDDYGIYTVHVFNSMYPLLELATGAVGYGVRLEAGIVEDDYNILVELYNATGGDNWIRNDNWKTGFASKWFGIIVKDGRVSEINLPANNLSGNIPSSITGLNDLRKMDLMSNEIDMLPDLDGWGENQKGIMKVAKNNLTFIDIEPNYERLMPGYVFPQDTLQLNTSEFTFPVGGKGSIDLSQILERNAGGDNTRYQWVHGNDYHGSLSSFDILSFPFMSYQDEGNYYCLVSNIGVPGYILTTTTFDVYGQTGIDGIALEEAILYPNPVVDFLNIKMGAMPGSDIEVSVIDAMGRLLYLKKHNGIFFRVPFNSMIPGIYHLRLRIDNKIKAYRVVKF